MISPDAELRAYITNIETGGVPILDRVTEDQAYPYVHIQDITCSDFSTADQPDIWQSEILLDVVTGFDGDSGGRKHADEIGNFILAAMLLNRPINIGQHNIAVSELLNSTYIDESIGSHYIIRKLIRIGMYIEKKADQFNYDLNFNVS